MSLGARFDYSLGVDQLPEAVKGPQELGFYYIESSSDQLTVNLSEGH